MSEIEYIFEAYIDGCIFVPEQPLGMLFASIVIIILFKMRKDARKFLVFIIITFMTMSGYGIFESYTHKQLVRDAFINKSFKCVEGNIENLHIMPKNGHDSERFDINGIHFEIGYTGDYPNAKTLFYTLTKNRNGPIQKNGQKVKIYYIEDDLPKLCIPFTDRCIIFNENQKNKIIKMWVYKEGIEA